MINKLLYNKKNIETNSDFYYLLKPIDYRDFEKIVFSSPIYRKYCDDPTGKEFDLVCSLTGLNSAKEFVQKFSNIKINNVYITDDIKDYPEQIDFNFPEKTLKVAVYPLSSYKKTPIGEVFAYFNNDLSDTATVIYSLQALKITVFDYYCHLPNIHLIIEPDDRYFINNIVNLHTAYHLLKDAESRATFVSRIRTINTGYSGYLKTCCDTKEYFHEKIRPVEGDVIIDAGVSHCIDTILDFAKTVGNKGKIYSLEPEPNCYKLAKEQLDNLSEIKFIELHDCGLWDKKEILKISQSEIGGSTVIMNDGLPKTANCRVLPLDDFVKSHKIKKINFIKMDVEGAELKALKGAVKTMKKFKPKLSICVYHFPEHLFELLLFIDSLKLGYEFYLKHHSLIRPETVLYAQVKK